MGAYSSFMIYPFVCMEYYYLKFIRNSALVTNPAWIETCLSFGLLSDTNPPILGLEDDAADYTTYENFLQDSCTESPGTVCSYWNALEARG